MSSAMLSLGLPTKLSRGPSRAHPTLRINARPVRCKRSPPAAFGGMAPLASSGLVKLATTLLSSASLALGAMILSQTVTLEQDKLEQREACPSCGGTGYEPCICTRWSDGDVGCQSCGHTGYKRCKKCGGGGTAVPIPVAIRKDDQSRMH